MADRMSYWWRKSVGFLASPVLPVAFLLLWALIDWNGPRQAEAGGTTQALDRASVDEAEGGGEAAANETTKQLREDRLEQMRQRSQATKVYRLADGGQTPVDSLPEPLFRYSDQPRLILDATVWGFGTSGRPIAVQKVELYRRAEGQPKWLYCMASLSEGRLEARWPDGRRWTSNKAGIELRALPDGPAAAERPFARLLQIKKMAGRFSATVSDPPAGWQEQVRPLPQPVYRYGDPASELLDGAIFAYATNGTNPDLLLIIELHGPDASNSTWKYALARMTAARVSARLDGKEVWSVPYVSPPGPRVPAKFDTWAFLFETPEAQGKRKPPGR